MADVTGNDSAESYSAAVREVGGVWKNGNGNGAVQLDAGVATLKAQLQAFQQAKATQQQFAIAQLQLSMEQQHARMLRDGLKTKLTEALADSRWEKVAELVSALCEASVRLVAIGGR